MQLWPIFEILLGVLALRLRQLAEPSVELAEVRLPRPAPRDVAPWLRVFAVRPKFDADHAAFRLPSLLLERPLRTADPAVRDALGTSSLQTMRDQVTAHIRAWVREAPDADQVARSLGLSRRTLQRRLVEAIARIENRMRRLIHQAGDRARPMRFHFAPAPLKRPTASARRPRRAPRKRGPDRPCPS